MPSVLEPPQILPVTQDRQSTLVHRIAVNVMRLAMLVAIAGIFGGGCYLAKRGFSREGRYPVDEELPKRGHEAAVGRFTLDPFRGLVAQHLRTLDYQNRGNT